MLSIVLDGLHILNIYKEAIVIFFITIFGVGFYSTGLILNREVDVKIRMLASFSVGSIFLCVISFLFIILFHFLGLPLQIGGYALVLFAAFVVVKGFWSGEFKKVYTVRASILAVALFGLLLIRLAFLKHILLPPYSDSPIHYQIVSDFLHPDTASVSKLSLHTIFSNYYHFGFHSLVAWLTSVTELEPAGMILLVGQLFLVIAPIPMVFLMYTFTRDANGALFAGLLTAIGWSMPAFAVNWGKFPALLSVALLPVVVPLPLLLLDAKIKRTGTFIYGVILLMGITFIHTRILISLLLIFTSFVVVYKLQFIKNEFEFFQSVRYTLLFILSLWPLSRSFIDFYGEIPILVILLILIPFAFQSYPAISVGIFVFLSGLSLITLIPNMLSVGGRTLLDRQFLAMILFIPLSLMGGLGFGGLIKRLDITNPALKRIVIIVCVGCVVASLKPRSFYPDPCCNYFNENDRLAFQWIQENSSSHTLYFMSTYAEDGKIYGTDAGMWIFPITQIATNKLPFNTQWTSAGVLSEVCPSEVSDAYIYMGGEAASFDDNQLSHLAWVDPVFQAGEVVIYKITDCSL